MPNLSDLAGYGRDFLQGASNAAASNISAPVDGLAWLLKKGGMNIQNPVGGSDWMAKQGLTQQPQSRLAGLLGESVGGVAPMLAAAKAPQIASGINTMINNGLTQKTMNPQTGAVVWHGSPHTFDKFDASKIGTGEGAQAYGNGLYVADTKAVAQGYQKTLSNRYDQVFLKGQPIEDQMSDTAMAIRKYNQDGGNFTQWKNQTADRMNGAAMNGPGAGNPERAGQLRDSANTIRGLQAADVKNTGSLYKVDLPDEHIARMLDWDKPLSQQHPDVQKAFQTPEVASRVNALKSSGQLGDYSPQQLMQLKGEDWHDLLRQSSGDSNSAPADYLKKQGIPGVRYLDGGSRATGGTSNYVVFPGNEHMLTITQRNGQNIK